MSESCGNPNFESEALMSRRPKYDKTKICVRCKLAMGSVVIRHVVYCKPCFGPMVATKFRRTLEPHINVTPDAGPRRKALKAPGSLLLGFSGGLGSVVLLDLVNRSYFPPSNSTGDASSEQTKSGNGIGLRDEKAERRGGKDHPRNLRVWDKGSVCYVEICGAFPGMRDRTEEMRDLVNSNFPQLEFISARLEDAFDDAWWNAVGGKLVDGAFRVDVSSEELHLSAMSGEATPADRLQKYISLLPTQTAIPSAIQDLTRLILLHTALYRNASHLLLGTSLTSLSVSLISSISQGGGFNVREEAQEEWIPPDSRSRPSQIPIRIIRPLRDVGLKECAMWAWWNGLHIPGREKHPGGKQGVGALTYNFITGLERDFPSTVSAIARTCAKLEPKQVSESHCILCQRPAQPGIQDWKERISIRSFIDSSIIPPPHVSRDGIFAKEKSDSGDLPSPGLTPLLCYACHTTLTSRSPRGTARNADMASPLPSWVNSRLSDSIATTRKMGEGAMRDSIRDFLLEEDP
ncbi:hypothetical protein BDN72DRAFT_787883 [Pluteus cervinus]|uniref:Uncharacterized protein n=1 Tax=Pluteus cervinus TaxID=181527 RepID=A0ACD3BC95_9AGAR|nr:hypothetical protein BDN72DRAFT_787883 [Pluteus cervinus]